MRNQSFQLGPLIDSFLADKKCAKLLQRHYQLGRSLTWFCRVFALVIGGLSVEDMADCIGVQGSSSTDSSGEHGPSYVKQNPFNFTALKAAIDHLSIDPLRMMVQDMSMPELFMLMAARRRSQLAADKETGKYASSLVCCNCVPNVNIGDFLISNIKLAQVSVELLYFDCC